MQQFHHPPSTAQQTRLYRANAPSYRTRHNIGNSSLPPLPPNSLNSRSHSLDGLLESDGSKSQNIAGEGLNEKRNLSSSSKKLNNKNEPMSLRYHNVDSKENIRTTKNRRSKSLDDLLDEDEMLILVDDEARSMENIEASNESLSHVSPVPSEKLCENEVITIDNSILHENKNESIEDQDDSGIHSDVCKLQSDTSSLDDDALSNTVSITSSTASERKPSKTLLNKYVRKVKNLMKK